MRLLLATAACLATTTASMATAPDLSFVTQGADIVGVDEQLRSNGWQAVRISMAQREGKGSQFENTYHELGITSVQWCRWTAFAGCTYVYRDALGNFLHLRTIGEDGGGDVEEWQLNRALEWVPEPYLGESPSSSGRTAESAATRQLTTSWECNQMFDRVAMGGIVTSVERRLLRDGWSEQAITDLILETSEDAPRLPPTNANEQECVASMRRDEYQMKVFFGADEAPTLPEFTTRVDAPPPVARSEPPVIERDDAVERPTDLTPSFGRSTASHSELLDLMRQCMKLEVGRPSASRGGISANEFCAASAVLQGSR